MFWQPVAKRREAASCAARGDRDLSDAIERAPRNEADDCRSGFSINCQRRAAFCGFGGYRKMFRKCAAAGW